MFAQIGVDRLSRRLQFLCEQTGHERQTAAAAGARLRERFHVADDREIVVTNRTADVTLGDAVALTHLYVIRHLAGRDDAAAVRAEHQCPRFSLQLSLALREHQKAAVVGRVTDQDAANQLLTVEAEQQLFVHAAERVFIRERLGSGFVGSVVPETRHINAHELEFRREVGAAERPCFIAGQPGCKNLRHLIAGSDEPVHHPAVQSDFTDGVDVRAAGL